MSTTEQNHNKQKLVIAGPCAAETPEQIQFSLEQALLRNVDYVRISLWKPRTKPGFEGMGLEQGIPLLQHAINMGLNPATEIMVPEQAEAILDAVLPMLGNRRIMLWIGARNQNHMIQRDIAKAAARDNRVALMVKNQPWPDEKHFEGIAEHVLSSGIEAGNVMLCHRGFLPTSHNPHNWRNLPDSPMAMRIREKTGLKMILDLSHTAGHSDKIKDVAMEAVMFPYDGTITEVHPNPSVAWTDASQQITWNEFDDILERMNAAASLTIREKVLQA